MDIISQLSDEAAWHSFLEYKLAKGHLNTAERKSLEAYITSKSYVQPAKAIQESLTLPPPVMKEINKTGTGKKRTVFSFGENENNVLKLLTFLLRKYDCLFSDNLFSFRMDRGVRKAIERRLYGMDLARVYSYKVDIHDYFNSVNQELMLETVRKELNDEPRLVRFIENVLTDPTALKDGEPVSARKGVMAGVPFSGFLANLYLREMDEWFAERSTRYLRYSDDIIVFADSEAEIRDFEAVIKRFLADKKLEINPAKEIYTAPGENIEFLGFCFTGSEIRISDVSVQKIKDKLKRKSRALYRWRIRKNLDGGKAAKAYIRFLNRKFYNNTADGEITWCRWYFPVITSEAALKEIDDYAVACIRYLYTGRYGKQNYNIRYDEIKALGFRSLVNSFWRFKNGSYET